MILIKQEFIADLLGKHEWWGGKFLRCFISKKENSEQPNQNKQSSDSDLKPGLSETQGRSVNLYTTTQR